MIPTYIDPWKPYPLVKFSYKGNRSNDLYKEVVAQFQVAVNPRYTPRDLNADGTRETFCNIFMWDVSRAMSAEIPHWVDPTSLDPVPFGTKGAHELSANGAARWLAQKGGKFGWRACSEMSARAAAGMGMPSIAIWDNHTGIGHVAVVVPSPVGATFIAQAGATCFEYGPITKGFGRIKPTFYTSI